MKLRKLKFILPMVASLSVLGGCDWIQIIDQPGQTVVDVVTVDKYYEGYNVVGTTLSGGRLQNTLHQMCFDKHKVFITYSQVNSYFSKTASHDSAEAVAAGSNLNQWFYTGKEAKGTGTREHVWPCANSGSLWVHNEDDGKHYVDSTSYVGGGSDLYHVRTSNSAVNTARGNSRFVDFDDDEMANFRGGIIPVGENNGKYDLKLQGSKFTEDNKQFADRAEPDDHMKGDVARIILYVWIHYNDFGGSITGSYNYKVGTKSYSMPYADMIGSLSLTNVIGYSSLEKCQATLKEWNRIDPPSDVEKLRNTTVQKIQGNRNPFVDYPDLVDRLF